MVRGLFAGLNSRYPLMIVDCSFAWIATMDLKGMTWNCYSPRSKGRPSYRWQRHGHEHRDWRRSSQWHSVPSPKIPGPAKLHLCHLLNCIFFCRSLDRIEKAHILTFFRGGLISLYWDPKRMRFLSGSAPWNKKAFPERKAKDSTWWPYQTLRRTPS